MRGWYRWYQTRKCVRWTQIADDCDLMCVFTSTRRWKGGSGLFQLNGADGGANVSADDDEEIAIARWRKSLSRDSDRRLRWTQPNRASWRRCGAPAFSRRTRCRR